MAQQAKEIQSARLRKFVPIGSFEANDENRAPQGQLPSARQYVHPFHMSEEAEALKRMHKQASLNIR